MMEARKGKRSRSPSPLSKKFLVPPIDELPYTGHIEKFLQSKIREQNIANIRNRTSYTGHVPPNLHKLLFTETVRWVKHLLGMDYIVLNKCSQTTDAGAADRGYGRTSGGVESGAHN